MLIIRLGLKPQCLRLGLKSQCLGLKPQCLGLEPQYLGLGFATTVSCPTTGSHRLCCSSDTYMATSFSGKTLTAFANHKTFISQIELWTILLTLASRDA